MSNQAGSVDPTDAAEPTGPATYSPTAPADISGDEHAPMSAEHQVVVRRSPRYFRLMGIFAGLGAIAAFISAFAIEAPEGYSQAQVFGYLLLWGVVAGIVIGSLVGLLLDRIVGRKTTALKANKLAVSSTVVSDADESTEPEHPETELPK